MMRLILLLGALLISVVGGDFLMRYPGTVVITWLGQHTEMTIGAFGLFFLGAVVASVAVILGVRAVMRLPERWRAYRLRQRFEKTQDLIVKVLEAHAHPDSASWSSLAHQARSHQLSSVLTLFFQAQQACQQRNGGKAEDLYLKLKQDPQGHFLGAVGLVRLYQHQQRPTLLQAACQEALEQVPTCLWIRLVWLDTLLEGKNFEKLLTLTLHSVRRGSMTTDQAKPYLMSAYKGLAAQAHQEQDALTVKAMADKAYRLDPDDTEAVLLQARCFLDQAKPEKAQRILEKAWQSKPDVVLVGVYMQCQKSADPYHRFEASQRLASFAPQDPESHLVLIQSALNASLLGEAEHHIQYLLSQGYRTDRFLSLMKETDHLRLQMASGSLHTPSLSSQPPLMKH
jgi:uncharacterized membrane-anchored protein